MPAFYHTSPTGDGTSFRFAAKAAELLDQTGVKWVACPEFDFRESRGYVSDADLFDAGWTVGCRHCQRLVDADDFDLDPVVSGGVVYCGESCQREEIADRELIVANKAAARAALAARAPWVVPADAWNGGAGACDAKCWDRDRGNVCVHFSVPGPLRGRSRGEPGGLTGAHSTYCHGCGRLFVCKGDLEAFRALRASHQKEPHA